MNILHISTADHGGAGKAALRLHLGLKSVGVKSKMLVLYQESQDRDVVEFKESKNILRRAWYRMRDELLRNKPQEPDLFSNTRTAYSISKHPLVREADIITLRWITNLVDHGEFFSNIGKKHILWRLSDMNPFTGGCHYSGGCVEYQTGCGSCPNLRSGLTKQIFKKKEKAYRGRNIHIVVPSKWLRDCAGRSLLFKNLKIDVIPNGVSTDVFKKRDRKLSLDLLNLPYDKILILYGADYKAKRKGFKYLLEALRFLKEKITPSNVALVTFGPEEDLDTFSKETGFPVYQLGHIRDDALLSCVYSAADMLIVPSTEESMPNTMLESMACQTATLGFKTGGIPEIIAPRETGFLAEVKDARDLARQIEYIMTHPEERQRIEENARKLIEEKYNLQRQARAYLRLYEEMFKI